MKIKTLGLSLAVVTALGLGLTGCGSSNGSNIEETINLDGNWTVTITDTNGSDTNTSTFAKRTVADICRAYHDPFQINGKNMYFEHYTWHVTDTDTAYFTNGFVENWCLNNGYKKVTQETINKIITTLNEYPNANYPNVPCSIKSFKESNITLECQNGWKETYIKQ